LIGKASTTRNPFEYLVELSNHPIRLGLEPLRHLLARLKNPERNFVSIIIGGTNGKGSIAAMAASILNAGGFRTGLYTSPHLLDIRERIRINGRMIAMEEMQICGDVIMHQLREDLTYFEFLTAMAFQYFSQQRVDVAVLEVGMGGRLDATNVVDPAVSVISNIALDHRQYLGKKLEQIAREKSGIIKRGGRCLTAASQKPIIDIFRKTCQKKQAHFLRLGGEIKVRKQADGLFSFRGQSKHYNHLMCPLRGSHQIDNAALAIGAVLLLADQGLSIKEEAIRRGLRETQWEGRLEILHANPMILIDGAHNPAGISTLCAALKNEFHYRSLTVIFGVLNDKDCRSMLRKISPLADRLILTRPESERASSPEIILSLAMQYHRRVSIIEKPEQALQESVACAASDDLICVTGSLYLMTAAKRFIIERCGT